MLVKYFEAIKRQRELVLMLIVFFYVGVMSYFVFGKMSMGDNTTELAYGQMVRAGLIPYNDFYIHIMPLTAYVAAFIETLRYPIHLINIITVLNLVFGATIVYGFCKILRLHFWEKIIGYGIFFGMYCITLLGFNHHSFDLTTAGAATLFLIYLLQTPNKKSIYIYSFVISVCGVSALFLTQHIGLAVLVSGPAVLIADYFINKNKERLFAFGTLVLMEILVFCLALGFFAWQNVPIGQMFKTAFLTGFSQYTGTYGHFAIWKDAFNNLLGGLTHYLGGQIVASTPISVGVQPDNFVPAGTIVTANIFYKIFLNKVGLINTLANITILILVLWMVFQFVMEVIDIVQKRKVIDSVWLVWVVTLGTFLLASTVVFQINFSGFYYIFLLWLYVSRNSSFGLNKYVRNASLVIFAVLGLALMVGNLNILRYEHQTREYFISQMQNETVWLSPFYYRNFVSELSVVRGVLKSEMNSSTTFTAYPRASEIFYLLDKTPQKGTSMATFFHENGQYQSAVSIATSSDILVVYEPKFYGDNLGAEHDFAMNLIQNDLHKNFNLLHQSRFFQVYKRINYGK
jgi:hypothetical protein